MNFFVRQMRKAANVTKTLLSLDANTKRWNALRGRYAGERVFLIGNGPSLNETPLHLLKNEFTLCFNRFHLLHERLNWRPYFYMCIDPEVLPGIASEINEHCHQYRFVFVHALHAKGVVRRDNVLLMHHVVQVPYFSMRLPLFGSGGTVAYAGLQALMYMGFSEILLVGVDQNYVLHKSAVATKGIRIESQSDDDPNHFDPRYFGKGMRYHQPVEATRRRMIRAFERARSMASGLGVSIKNAGIGGRLEVYERIGLRELLALGSDDEYQMLAECIGESCDPDKVRAFVEEASPAASASVDTLADIFVGEGGTAARWIPKLIGEYIPFGPIAGRYVFVRRDEKPRIVRSMFARR